MFALPYPYAETPEKRNANRTADVKQQVGTVIQELNAQLKAMTELRESLDAEPWQRAAQYGYQRAEWVGRHIDTMANAQRRIDDAALTAAVIAGGFENETPTPSTEGD